MKFLIDEDSPHSLKNIFQKHGQDSVHVRDVLGSTPDKEIFDYANKHQYIIVTRDLGFAEIFIKNRGFGLLLIRLPYYFTAEKIAKAFDEFLKEANVKEFVNSIIVLELGRYRIKRL